MLKFITYTIYECYLCSQIFILILLLFMSPKPNQFGCFCQGKDAALPLRKVSHDIRITDSVAHVRLSQTYRNSAGQSIEIQYRFPINSNRCLVHFAAVFAEKTLLGVVKERKAASMEYQEALQSGIKAVFAEVTEERSDVMLLKIGNLRQHQEVRVELSYLQELSVSLNTFYRFDLPLCFSQGETHLLTQHGQGGRRIEGETQWDFALRVQSAKRILKYFSETHSLKLINASRDESSLQIGVEQPSSNVDNRFTFLFAVEDFELPSYVLGQTDLGTSLMVSFIPKFCRLSVDDAQAAHLKAGELQVDLGSVRGEYVFLLDRSGSMGGDRIEEAKESLISFLKNLPKDSFFNVLSFGSQHQRMFEKSIRLSQQSIASAVRLVDGMEADLGGTEILTPLQQLLNEEVIRGYPRHVFLLTDGEVSDTNAIVDLVRRSIKHSRVHTIGVGKGVSKELIRECARAGKGNHAFISESGNLNKKVSQLLRDSLTPLISEVKLEYDEAIVESIVPNPESIPFILKGEIVNFFVFFKERLTRPTKVSLSYTDSLNKLPYRSSVEISENTKPIDFIDKLAAFKKIKCLETVQAIAGLGEGKAALEGQLYSAKDFDVKQKMIEISVNYQILSKHTAIVCVDKDVPDEAINALATSPQQKEKIILLPKSKNYKGSKSSKGGKVGRCKLKSTSQSTRAGLQLPVGRIRRYLKKQLGCLRVSRTSSVYLTAVAQYLVAQICEIAGNTAKNLKSNRINPKHIKLAIDQDQEFKRFIIGTIHEGGFTQTNLVNRNQRRQLRLFARKLMQHQSVQGYWDNARLLKNIVTMRFLQENAEPSIVLITSIILEWLQMNVKALKGMKRMIKNAKVWVVSQGLARVSYAKYFV